VELVGELFWKSLGLLSYHIGYPRAHTRAEHWTNGAHHHAGNHLSIDAFVDFIRFDTSGSRSACDEFPGR
jgi:hypothetical protein